MKTLAYTGILFCLNFLAFKAWAQNAPQVRYYNQTVAGWSHGIGNVSRYFNGYESVDKNEEWSAELTTVHGIQYKKHQFGLGTGMDVWKTRWYVPFFAQYKITFGYRKVNPYGSMEGGFSFGPRRLNYYKAFETNYLFFRLALGVQVKLGTKINLVTNVFYKMQGLRATYESKSVMWTPEPDIPIQYTMRYHFMGVGVGIKI